MTRAESRAERAGLRLEDVPAHRWLSSGAGTSSKRLAEVEARLGLVRAVEVAGERSSLIALLP